MIREKSIQLFHGSGGIKMHGLIRELFLKRLRNPELEELSDSAKIGSKEKIAFTTDSFVVSPLFFFGGDIGKLAVCGTVNDLAVSGAQPEYISLGVIIEEGLGLNILEKIVDSIAKAVKQAKVKVVTGDLKVVEKGAADKIFINTSGIGRLLRGGLSVKSIRQGDKIILTGDIGRHGLAVLAKRKSLDLGFKIESDCAALNQLLEPVVKNVKGLRFMRDPTRGGLATTLNEISHAGGLGIYIDEKRIPVSSKVRAACELTGMDPLYVANEGRAIIIVSKGDAQKALNILKKNPLGRGASIIGEVTGKDKGRVILRTAIATKRIVEMLSGEPLPRIC